MSDRVPNKRMVLNHFPQIQSKMSILRQPILLTSVFITGLLLGAKHLGWLVPLELHMYDGLVRLQPRQETDPRILIVGITDSDIQSQQQWPLSDQILAQAINQLQQYRPKVIGIDLYRDIDHPPGEADLAQQLSANNVIGIEAYGHVPPPPSMPKDRIGFNDVVIDPDGVVRRHLMFTTVDDQEYYSFGLRLSLKYLAPQNLDLEFMPDHLNIGSATFQALKPNSGGYQSADTQGYQTLLRYRSAKPIARQVTLTQLLNGEIEADWVQDKVVIMGTTTPSEQDIFFTPLTLQETDRAGTPGVELHAQMVSQILNTVLDTNSQLFWFWNEGAEGVWIWVWSFIGGVIVWKIKHPLRLGLVSAGAVTSLMGLQTLLFFQMGWVPMMASILGLLSTGVGVLAYRRFYQLWHDPLTQLANVEHFLLSTQKSLNSHAAHPTQIVILALGIDRFSLIHNSIGNEAGAELLMNLVSRWKNCLRNGEIIARISDDVFAVLVNDISDVQDGIRVANRLQKQLKEPLVTQGQEFYLPLHIGLAVNQAAKHSAPEKILNDAIAAMHCARTRDQSFYSIFSEGMREQINQEAILESEMRQALAKEEFQVYYQPINNLKTGKIIGFEALVRWIHPERGFISPGAFIPLAEKTGLILPLGQWVFKAACQQMQAWQNQFGDRVRLVMSINLSIKQLAQPDLVEQFDRIVQEHQLMGDQLKLEITESTMMENLTEVQPILLRLKRMGIQFSIDDFGTGYSSLSYLPRLPIDNLKIDRSFVSRMNETNDDAEIVKMIIMLSHQLKLKVIAEGIETESQLLQLKSLGCDYAQGYFFSKPVPSEGATTLLEQDYSVSGEPRIEDGLAQEQLQ